MVVFCDAVPRSLVDIANATEVLIAFIVRVKIEAENVTPKRWN
jgi:hypothetical protein